MAEIITERIILNFATGKMVSPKQLLDLLRIAESDQQQDSSANLVDHSAEVHAKLDALHERRRAIKAADEERARRGLPPLR